MRIQRNFLLIIFFAFSCSGEKQRNVDESAQKEALKLYEIGLEKFNNKEYEIAVENFTQATILDNDYYKAYSFLAEVQFLHTHEYNKSLTNFDSAISLHSDSIIGIYAEDYIFRAGVKKELKQYEGAIKDFNTSLGIIDIAYTYHKIGDCFLELSDTTQACHYWNVAITKGYDFEKSKKDTYCN